MQPIKVVSTHVAIILHGHSGFFDLEIVFDAIPGKAINSLSEKISESAVEVLRQMPPINVLLIRTVDFSLAQKRS